VTFAQARAVQDWPGLPRAQRAVLISIALRANRPGDCWPAVERISAETGYGATWVRRTIRDLAGAGFLDVVHRPGKTFHLRLSSAIRVEAKRVTERAQARHWARGARHSVAGEVCSEVDIEVSAPHPARPPGGVPTEPGGTGHGPWSPARQPLGIAECLHCAGSGWQEIEVPTPGVAACGCRAAARP
jgi:hypothetical protein